LHQRRGRLLSSSASPLATLAGILDDAISWHLDADTLGEDRASEDQERRQIARALPSAD